MYRITSTWGSQGDDSVAETDEDGVHCNDLGRQCEPTVRIERENDDSGILLQ